MICQGKSTKYFVRKHFMTYQAAVHFSLFTVIKQWIFFFVSRLTPLDGIEVLLLGYFQYPPCNKKQKYCHHENSTWSLFFNACIIAKCEYSTYIGYKQSCVKVSSCCRQLNTSRTNILEEWGKSSGNVPNKKVCKKANGSIHEKWGKESEFRKVIKYPPLLVAWETWSQWKLGERVTLGIV